MEVDSVAFDELAADEEHRESPAKGGAFGHCML